jgi:hypothetical protein
MGILRTFHVHLYEAETVRMKLVLDPLTMIGVPQAGGIMMVRRSIRGAAEIGEDSLEAFTVRSVRVQDSLTIH